MNCKNCKYLGDKITVDNSDDLEPRVDTEFYKCKKISPSTIGTGYSSVIDHNFLVEEKREDACVVGSGSGSNKFLVKEDFSCSMHEVDVVITCFGVNDIEIQ